MFTVPLQCEASSLLPALLSGATSRVGDPGRHSSQGPHPFK